MFDLFNKVVKKLDEEQPTETTRKPTFDLADKLGDEEKQTGITPLDIMELPRTQKQIMNLLLRDHSASVTGITLEGLRERLPDQDDLPEALEILAHQSWVIVLGEPPNVRYKINLRRKRGGSLSSMWSSVMDHLSTEPIHVKPGIFKIIDKDSPGSKD